MPMLLDEFRARLWAAQWEYLDRLAARIDRRYEELGIPKRRIDRDERHSHLKSKHTMRHRKGT